MREGARRLVLAGLLVAAALTVGWLQLEGGPARTGVADLDPRPMDVAAAADVADEGERTLVQTQPGMLTLDGQLAALAINETAPCQLITLPAEAPGERTRRAIDGCKDGELNAYDDERDRLLVCRISRGTGEPVLTAYERASLEPAWTIAPGDLGVQAAEDANLRCAGAAVDDARDRVVVPFFRDTEETYGSAHRIAALDLDDGEPRWIRSVDPATFRDAEASGLPPDPSRRSSTWAPAAATVLPEGIVVTGFERCACSTDRVSTTRFATAWLDHDGATVGGTAAQDPTAGPDPALGGSFPVTSRERVGAQVLGERLAFLDPTVEDPVRTATPPALEDLRGLQLLAMPAWTQDAIVLPLDRSLVGLDPGTLEADWIYQAPGDRRIEAMLPDERGRAHLLLAGPEEPEANLTVEVVDLATGLRQHRLPLPVPAQIDGPATAGGVWNARLLPAPGGGVAMLGENGELALLEPREGVGGPTVEDRFPAPTEPTTVQLPAILDGRPVAAWTLAWGDGTVTEAARGEAEHAYGDAGDRTLTATAVLNDGTTRTSEHVVHVGGTPPPDLNLLQEAFAPENQDVTFGVLGLATTLVGGLIALARRRRRKTRLARELERLDEIRARSREDPVQGAVALQRYRARVRDRLEEGELDDRAFGVLEVQLARLVDRLQERLMAPYEDELTPAFLGAFRTAFEDGALDAEEHDRLRERLAGEPLEPGQRRELAELLSALSEGSVFETAS